VADLDDGAWGVSFGSGHIDGYGVDDDARVLCVR